MKGVESESQRSQLDNRTPAVNRGIQFIQSHIVSGQYSHGSKLPSESELSGATGLSRGTIRKSIETLIETGDLKRKHSSRPIVTGRSTPQVRQIAKEIHVWITQPIANPVSLHFLKGVSAGLMGTQFQTVVREPIRFVDNQIGEEEREFLINVLESPHVAGAILERDPFAKNDDLFARILAEGRHLVFVDIVAPDGINADHVGTCNVSATRKAATHLISLGHQDIWYITDSDVAQSSLDRIVGYRRALSQAGLSDRERVIVATSLPEVDPSSLSPAGPLVSQVKGSSNYSDLGRRVVSALLNNPNAPTAIMVNCDALALAILAFLEGAGAKVPENMAVMGFDWISRWHDPSGDVLSTMAQDFEGFGIHAADLLLDRLSTNREFSPRHVLLDAPLVLRSSTELPSR